MDETVSEDEIREAVAKALEVAQDKFEVRALRPAYGGKQNATLKMLESDANKLRQAGSIRIGWTKARILERERISGCTRCWEPGHTRADCSGPDRSLFCMKCGKPGHEIAVCSNEPFCLVCNRVGHRTGNKTCPGDLDRGRKADINNAQSSSD